MNRLDYKIAYHLNCQVKNLNDKLNHPENLDKVNKLLHGKNLVTLYKNHIGEHKEFAYGGLSKKSARCQMAYNGFKNVTVDQHFYVRHRISLQFSSNPCVIEKCKNGHMCFYPLELVGIADCFVSPLTKTQCLGNHQQQKQQFCKPPTTNVQQNKDLNFINNDEEEEEENFSWISRPNITDYIW